MPDLKIKKQVNSPAAMATAAAWNAPGGGYDQHVAQDSQREKDFPPGTPVRGEGAKPAPQPKKEQARKRGGLYPE